MADSKDKADTAPEAAPKAGKGNLILIVVIAVLSTLLIGGGITAVILMKHSGPPAAASDDAADESSSKADSKKADVKKKDKEPKKKDEAKGAPIYIPLEPPFVVNFDASQSVRFLQVTVEIMTRDTATAEAIKSNNPLVRNDLLLLFGNQDATVLTTREGKEGLRKLGLEAIRKVVANEGGKGDLVEAIYFTSFVMQ